MTLKQFHNLLRVLHSIDQHELWGDLANDQYYRFQKEPAAYFIRCCDHLRGKIWEAMVKRAPEVLCFRALERSV